MNDICKCNPVANLCKLKEECYRYLVEASPLQPYTDFSTDMGKDGMICKWFIKDKKRGEK